MGSQFLGHPPAERNRDFQNHACNRSGSRGIQPGRSRLRNRGSFPQPEAVLQRMEIPVEKRPAGGTGYPVNNARFRLLPGFLLVLLALAPVAAHARDAKEDARIEHLISSVEKLEGAKFIRNGTEYDPKDAGAHLRMKLGKAGDRVKTAKDFIDGIASKSSFSGNPYKIRKKDGSITHTRPYFYTRLREYDKAHP